MSSVILSAEQRQTLKAIAEGSAKEKLKKRAQILLQWDAGVPSKQIADELGISERSIRYWRHMFQQHGMDIFHLSPIDQIPEEDNRLTQPPKNIKKPKTPQIQKTDPMQRAGVKVFRHCLKQILDNEDGTRKGEDIEALHDMRVATRRLRAALRLFNPYYPKKEIKRIQRAARQCGQALGRVRDLDVFMEKAKEDFVSMESTASQDVLPLTALWEEEHADARQALLDYLDSADYSQFITDLKAFIDKYSESGNNSDNQNKPRPSRVNECVPILIYQRFAEVCAFDPIIEMASFEQLHELRRAFKMFRYTLEFFSEVLGQEETHYIIQECKKIQDHLGNLNDAHNACLLITRYKTLYEERQDNRLLYERQNPSIFLTYLMKKEEQRYHLLSTFTEVWRAFYSPTIKQYLARAIAAI